MIAKGATEISKVCLGENELSKVCLGSTELWSAASPLPYDARVEYLDSNLTPLNRNHIDTGIIPNNNHTIRFVTSVMFDDINRRSVISNYSVSPCIAIEIQVSSKQSRLRTYSSQDGASKYTQTVGTVSLPSNVWIDIDATINFETKKWYVTYEFNGNEYTLNGNVYNTTYGCIETLLLFLDHRDSIDNIAHPLKMKYMQIIVDDVLRRDYIPVRISTTGYMYDNVTEQLYGNQGTGYFLFGNDITP